MILTNNLTEDELSLILYTLNVLCPTPPATEITVNRLKSYKPQCLAQKLSEVKDKLNDEGLEIYNSIFGKFQG